jgi:hypothetical protein
VRTDVDPHIAEAADCTTEIVLITFADAAATTAQAAKLRDLGTASGEGYHLLVGPNWIINAPKHWIDLVQPAVGGAAQYAPPRGSTAAPPPRR